MNETRDEQIVVRFTKKEKKLLKKIAFDRNDNLSELIRDCIFSCIGKGEIGKLGVKFLKEQIADIEKSLDNLFKNMKQIKKEIDLFEIKEIENSLAETTW